MCRIVDKKNVRITYVFIASLFVCANAVKWNWKIQEKISSELFFVFRMTLMFLIVLGIINLAFKRSEVYSKKYIVIGILAIVISALFFNNGMLARYNYYFYNDSRAELVEQIMKDEVILDNGKVCGYDAQTYGLPEDSYIGFIDSGKIQGVYFCTYRGMVDSSFGFLYVIDELDVEDAYNAEIKVLIKLSESCFYIGTH